MSLAVSRGEGNRITNYEEFESSLKPSNQQSLPRGQNHLLDGVVDLTDTVDTDRTVEQLPAVTHEFIQPIKHHVTHEQITREIHEYDVVHRILPVVDVEVLPTKHYIVDPDDPNKTIEIPEADIPTDSEAHYLVTNDPRAGAPVKITHEADQVPRNHRNTRSSLPPPDTRISESRHEQRETHATKHAPEPVSPTEQQKPKRGLRKRLSMILKQRLRHLRRKSQ